MSDPVARFFEAWAMTDAASRATAIGQVLSPQARYTDPRSDGTLEGPQAVTDYVAAFSANAPGWQATVVKSDQVGDLTRVTVAFGGPGPDGQTMTQHGQYFVAYDGEKIASMTGFVGTGTPE